MNQIAYRAAVGLMSLAIVVLTLVGCASLPPPDLDERVRSACTVYRSTPNALAV